MLVWCMFVLFAVILLGVVGFAACVVAGACWYCLSELIYLRGFWILD